VCLVTFGIFPLLYAVTARVNLSCRQRRYTRLTPEMGLLARQYRVERGVELADDLRKLILSMPLRHAAHYLLPFRGRPLRMAVAVERTSGLHLGDDLEGNRRERLLPVARPSIRLAVDLARRRDDVAALSAGIETGAELLDAVPNSFVIGEEQLRPAWLGHLPWGVCWLKGELLHCLVSALVGLLVEF